MTFRKYLFPFVFIIILGLAAVCSYLYWDQKVFDYLRENSLNWHRNAFIIAIGYLGKVWLLILLPLIWFLLTGRQRAVRTIFLALILVLIIIQPLKYGVRRTRPYEIVRAQQRGQQEQYLYSNLSFPSGDTACAFSVLVVIAAFVRWPYLILLIITSISIGLLRITEMAHYPSDVFFGAALGISAGWLALYIDKNWLLFENLRFVLNRNMVAATVIFIPIIFGLSEGSKKLLIFLILSIVLTAFLFIYSKTEYLTRKKDRTN